MVAPGSAGRVANRVAWSCRSPEASNADRSRDLVRRSFSQELLGLGARRWHHWEGVAARVAAADEDSSTTVLAPGTRGVWVQAGKGRELNTSLDMWQVMRQVEVGMRFEKSRLVRRGRSDRQVPACGSEA